MTTITGLNALPASTNTATSTTATPATYTNPVNASPYSQLSSIVVKLSGDSSIIAALDGSSTPLYTATGLLNTITQAGPTHATDNTTSATTPTTSPSTQNSTGGSTSASNASQSATSSINSNWASILAATPQASGALTADTTNQAIVSSL